MTPPAGFGDVSAIAITPDGKISYVATLEGVVTIKVGKEPWDVFVTP